jgi:hypothetical protein
MSRRRNPAKSAVVTLSLNPRTVWYVDRLLEAGLYGNNRAQAVSIVLYDHCKLLIAQGKLPEIPPIAGVAAIEVNPNP